MFEIRNKNYTLEKHLEEICKIDSEYKVLESIWLLNKNNISKGLNMVSSYFPNYSLHDSSHSMKIVENIQNYLGEERIKNLGATDTFLVLMSCLTHDIGMILSYKLMDQEWSKDNFEKQLDWFVEHGDKQIAAAATKIKNRNNSGTNTSNNYQWALEIKNAVIILTAEIFRGKHAKLSSDYLNHKEGFWELANNFYSEQLPSRFMELLSDVAFLHGEPFDEIFRLLHFQANGLKGDYIHPRFIACLIRLGDLLDFDSNRFNEFSVSSIQELPETSKLHKQKHAAVKHMLVSPYAIEADLDCDNEDIYRVSRAWFDMLEDEVNKQGREWTHIAPKDLTGLPPVISKNSIKISFKGENVKPELLNLKFTISPTKMFGILQGGAIYKEPGFAFIREIVQNALDASKLQLWADICDGIYDYDLSEKKLSEIGYPDDIPLQIYSQYPISLTIQWSDDKKESITITCEDKGSGISESTILRMTNYVGESHRMDRKYDLALKEMPFWLKPTAAFGIGLQSVFFVNKTFIVDTKATGEDSHQIIFRSAADNNYCSVIKGTLTKRGTKVKVKINKDNFSELFGNSFNIDILNNIDSFSENGDDKFLAKIDNYVYQNFRMLDHFDFNYRTVKSQRSFSVKKTDDTDHIEYQKCDKYKIGYYLKNDFLIFKIVECNFGSTINVHFPFSLVDRPFLKHDLLLRGVKISDARIDYYYNTYMTMEWNLYNESSECIVDLSRDKLLPKGYKYLSKILLKDLLPNMITKMVDLLERESTKNNKLLYQYFYAVLTAKMFDKNTNIKFNTLKKLDLLINSASDLSMNIVNSYDFLSSETLYIVSVSDDFANQNITRDTIANKITTSINHEDHSVIIWQESVYENYLEFTYYCDEIIYMQHYNIKKLTRIKDMTENKFVKSDDISCYLSLCKNKFLSWGSRSTIYPFEQYKKIIVKNKYINGFEDFPKYTNCCIYIPFNSEQQYCEICDEVIGKNNEDLSNFIYKKIHDIITQPLMETIINDSPLETKPTEDEIYITYTQLIVDMIKAIEKKNDKLQ